MTKQTFDTIDHVRLEVEVAPTGLTNLVANPDGVLGGWGWLTPAGNSRMTGSATTGLVYYAPIPQATSWFNSERFPIAAGQYAAASWVGLTASGTGTTYRAKFEWLDVNGNAFAASAQGGVIGSQSPGPQSLAPQQAPAGTVYARLSFDHYSTVGGVPPAESEVRLTDVRAAVASTSAALGSSRVNLVQNPAIETNTAWWEPNPGTTVGRTTTHAYAGTASMYVGLAFVPAIPLYPAAYATVPVTAGRDYTLQFRVKSDAPRYARAEIYWYDAAGQIIPNVGAARIGDLTSTSTWSLMWVTGTAPSRAVSARCYAGVTSQTQELHYLDALMVTEGRDVPAYFDGYTAAAGSRTYAWQGTHHGSPSTLTDTTLGSLVPTNWRNVMGPSHTIEIERQGLDLGTLDAEILDASLDPSQSNQLRPGRRVRLLVAQPDGTWEPLFTGKADALDVTYDEKAVPPKPPRISLAAVDGTTPLTTARRSRGVATVAELPGLLEGAGVPWNVNGSGNQVASFVAVSDNDNATALDQVAITRDTVLGAAWVDRRGVLRVEDRAELSPSPFPLGGTFDPVGSVDGFGYVFGRAPSYCTAARVTTPVRSGSGALRLTATSQASLWQYMGVMTQSGVSGMPVVGGRTYTARMWTRAATTPRGAFITGLGYKFNTLVQALQSTSAPVVNSTTGWTEHTLTFTAQPATQFVSFSLIIDGALPTGEVHYIDDFRLDLHRRNPLVLDEARYTDLDLTFSSADLINSANVRLLRLTATGETEEVKLGPYEDAASVTEWGRRSAEFTVHGIYEGSVPDYAAKILARNAVPKVRVNSLTMAVKSTADLTSTALVDLYDEPTVKYAAKGVDQVLQISSIRHTIEPEKWLVEVGFADVDSVASPTQAPRLPDTSVGTSWTEATLLNGFTAVPGESAQYRMDTAGNVWIRGNVYTSGNGGSTGTSSKAVFILPPGYRSSRIVRVTKGMGGAFVLDVTAAGEVKLFWDPTLGPTGNSDIGFSFNAAP